MNIFWTNQARDDRISIYEFIEEHNPFAALELDDSFDAKVAHLLENPRLGKPGRVNGTFELVVHPHYILVYDVTAEEIRIFRVLHSAMNYPI